MSLAPLQDNPDISLVDRACGCILGGAIGNAMGGPFEGQQGPLQYRGIEPWSVSDDTQLTLATCESIVECSGVSAEHVAAQFLRWFRARRITGMGASTLKALRDLDAGANWSLAGAKGEMSAGNGAAMRIAPLAFHLDPGINQDRQKIRDVCRITHHNEEAYVGALAVLTAIRLLSYLSVLPDVLLPAVVRYLPDSRIRDRVLEIIDLPDGLATGEVAMRFGSSGYVVDSVPLALYAVRFIIHQPLDVVIRGVVEAGGDTDTIGSMTGQVCGVWIGASQISRRLIDRLPDAPKIQRIASQFAGTIANFA